MGKWLWWYALERDALRRRVIDTKYGSIWWGWCSNIVQGPYEVFLWKSIRKGWDTFHCFVSFKAEDGSSIKFWQDPWCGGHPPMENFPDLNSIEHNKDDSVKSFYLSQEIATIGILVLTKRFKIGSWNWLPLLWIYYILECEGGDGVDKLNWKILSQGVFEVSSYYKVLPSPSHVFFLEDCVAMTT